MINMTGGKNVAKLKPQRAKQLTTQNIDLDFAVFFTPIFLDHEFTSNTQKCLIVKKKKKTAKERNTGNDLFLR